MATLDQSQTGYTGDQPEGTAQGFYPSVSGYLVSVSLYLKKTSGSGTCNLFLMTTKLDGSPKFSGGIVFNDVSAFSYSNTYTWCDYTLSTPFYLNYGTKYFLATNADVWGYNSDGDSYASEQAWTWGDIQHYDPLAGDMMFKTYMDFMTTSTSSSSSTSSTSGSTSSTSSSTSNSTSMSSSTSTTLLYLTDIMTIPRVR